MMTETNNEEQERYYCPECQAGVLKVKHVTYFAHVPGEMITVPDFPAWVCDICGFQEYDSFALTRLYVLLDPNTVRRPRRANQPHTSSDEAPAATISK
jgi:YgiT-type zinc finger domain-containing protein